MSFLSMFHLRPHCRRPDSRSQKIRSVSNTNAEALSHLTLCLARHTKHTSTSAYAVLLPCVSRITELLKADLASMTNEDGHTALHARFIFK